MSGRMIRFAACRGCGAVFAAAVVDAMDTETSLQFEAYRREGHTVDDAKGKVTLGACRCADRIAELTAERDMLAKALEQAIKHVSLFSAEDEPELAAYLRQKQAPTAQESTQESP